MAAERSTTSDATVVRCALCKAEFDPNDPAGCEVAFSGNHDWKLALALEKALGVSAGPGLIEEIESDA